MHLKITVCIVVYAQTLQATSKTVKIPVPIDKCTHLYYKESPRVTTVSWKHPRLYICLHFDVTISIQEVNIFNAEKVFADENRNCIVVLAKIFWIT